MTPDQDLSAPQIEWPDEIWAECDFEGGFGIYRTSFFATVDQPCEHAKYVHQGIHDSLKKYHATMVENGQLITLADHERAVQAAVAKAVDAALREHTGREETGESITEKYLRRYPRSKKTRAWEGAMVHLRTQNGIWRPDGHGYTLHFSEAWVLPLEEARRIVFGIYEDHGGTYYRASAAAIRSRGVAG